MTAAATVKTRILIISDTHCASLTSSDGSTRAPRPPFVLPLPKADLLIHCGDLTYTGEMSEYQQTLEMLREIDAPVKLIIAGNHDLSLDRDFVFGHHEQNGLTEEQAEFKWKQARDLWTASDGRAKMEGVTFLDEGVHQIELPNGASVNVYASAYTPEFCDWGFPYERDEDCFNTPGRKLSDAKCISRYPVPDPVSQAPVDIMITHGPPWARLDRTSKGDLAGCPHLLRAVMRARPLIHCFGHIHEGWGAEVVNWSPDAESATAEATSCAEWTGGKWESGIALDGGIERVSTDATAASELHAAYLDLSPSGWAIGQGKQTAMVNAAIMDVSYEPVNAPWLIDIDLPSGALEPSVRQ